jgi:hypothetical protein
VVRTCCESEADGAGESVQLREWKQPFRWPKANSFSPVPLYFNPKVVHKATFFESFEQLLGIHDLYDRQILLRDRHEGLDT